MSHSKSACQHPSGDISLWAPTRKIAHQQVEVIHLLGCSARRGSGCGIPGLNHRNESWGSSGHLVDLIYEAKGGKNPEWEKWTRAQQVSVQAQRPTYTVLLALDSLRHWKGTWKILRKALQSVGLPEERGRSRSFAQIKKQFW